MARTLAELCAFALDRSGHFIVRRAGLLLSAAGAWALLEGRFHALGSIPEAWNDLLLLCAIVGALLVRALVGVPRRRRRLTEAVDHFEFGLLLLVSVYIGVQLAGGPTSLAQPLAYIAVIYLVGFNTRGLGIVLTGTAVALQLLLALSSGAAAGFGPAVVQALYLVASGLASWIFLQTEIIRRRNEHERSLAQKISTMQQEARDFRLISSGLSSRAAEQRPMEEAKLARGAVDAIHLSMFFVLDLLKRCLNLQTCVLLWLDSAGRQLCIKEMVTDSTMLRETPIPAQAGALGGIVKNRLLLNLTRPRNGTRSIPYYNGMEQVGAFAGVPVIEDGHLRGVLCADRRSDLPFSAAEEKVLVDATQQIVRAIQTERVIAAVERSKYEHERFYGASTMLNEALTLSQVYERAFAAARQITAFDFGAVTLYDPDRKKHQICEVFVDSAGLGLNEDRAQQQRERFAGKEFGDNAGLVSMVVKNKHFLPAGEGLRDRDITVFTRKLRLGDAKSLVVLPLVVKDRAVGTFVLAARSSGRFPKQVREMLGVISNQVAVAVENAKMYKRMEEMATTDGLTDLPNHRTFQARFSEMLYRAERHAKPVSLVLMDVDHFKSVNDTYGHPVGDVVLKRVAQALAAEVRKVDLVARYGGEEFAIVLEDTDSDGARLLCERIRTQVAAQVMTSDKGGFRVTLSLGIASYLADGKIKETLIDRADQALYAAKQAGRNRTCCYADIRGRSARALG